MGMPCEGMMPPLYLEQAPLTDVDMHQVGTFCNEALLRYLMCHVAIGFGSLEEGLQGVQPRIDLSKLSA